MSVRENIELYGPARVEQLTEVLNDELGATKHPGQDNPHILENRPFYTPRQVEDHILILSFNNIPFPDSLVDALVDHPELFSDNILPRCPQ